MAKKKKLEKANENKIQAEKKIKKKNKIKEMGEFGKINKAASSRRERVDSSHDLPSGMDNVTVTIDEIMNKYYGKLHHEVINLGLKLVSEKINGASLRCLAILKAIIKFIKDYQLGKI